MELAGSLVGLGIGFVPVPALKLAFDILQFIWDSVQKASYNRKTLMNLAVSAADILTAVNHVLSHTSFNENVRMMLRNLEKVLGDIRDFAEKHASMNIFQTLVKSVDVEGKIEYFQNRLQVLSMAFNIAAYGAIESQLQSIIKQRALNSLPVPKKLMNSKQSVSDYEPVRTEATFSEPCTMEFRKGIPCISCVYFADLDLTRHWGLRNSGSRIEGGANTFRIVRTRDSCTWTWTLAWKMISVSIHIPAHSDWKDMMDIVFYDAASAAAWFSWLDAYASFKPVVPHPPASCDVTVRKKYDALMRMTPTKIERRRLSQKNWWTILNAQGKNSKANATYVTYDSADKLPHNMIYRSGDTIIVERYVRIQDDNPTVTRRYRFDTEAAALMWFGIWRDFIMSHGHESDSKKEGKSNKLWKTPT